MKNEFNKTDGTMLVTSKNTRISKKIEIIIKDTDIKCCANCKGFGHECNNGGAWVYCEIRHYHDNRFDGDCGELKGCQFFNKEKIEHEYEWLSKAFALNSSLDTNSCDDIKKTAIELKTHLDDLKDLMSDIDSLIDDIE